ncbi:MAG: hypothetical protein ACRCR2_03750 [Fusobacteriaceae bacterium]
MTMIQYLVDKNTLHSFDFNGCNSLHDLGIIILESGHLSSPESNIVEEQIPGRRGSLLRDEGEYSNFTLKLVCALDSFDEDINAKCRRIKRCLKGPRDYSRLVLSEDTDNYLEAVCIGKLDISEVVEQLGEFEIYFNCKPYRKLTEGENIITLTTPTILSNDFEASEPLIHLYGSGDITLKIADQEVILKGITNDIIIDSEELDAFRIDNVTKKMVNENGKMYSEFPYLRPGDNNISWTGNVTKLEITPRWVVI